MILDERIKNIVSDYKLSNVLDYLHNLALIIDLGAFLLSIWDFLSFIFHIYGEHKYAELKKS